MKIISPENPRITFGREEVFSDNEKKKTERSPRPRDGRVQ